MPPRIAFISICLLASFAIGCGRPAHVKPDPTTEPEPIIVPPVTLPNPPTPPVKLPVKPPQPEEVALPKPHVLYTFDGDKSNRGLGDAQLRILNAPLNSGFISLNGQYPQGSDTASDVTVTTPDIGYSGFTVAVRFKADQFAKPREGTDGVSPILVAGPGYRWFEIGRNSDGCVEVTFNNNRERIATRVEIAAEKWSVVICSVDALIGRMTVSVNGGNPERFDLPRKFAFEVAATDQRDIDKVWGFVNYSNGLTYKGQVGGFLIYDTALTAEQITKIPLKP